MTPYKQFCIVEIIEILQGIPCSKLNATNLLQVQEIDLLGLSGLSAELKAFKGFPYRSFQFAVEQRWRRGKIDFIVAFLCGVVHDSSAIHQNHHLLRANYDLGTVGDDICIALLIAAAPIAHLDATCHNGGFCHIVRRNIIQPRICQCSANRTNRCSNQTHCKNSFQNVLTDSFSNAEPACCYELFIFCTNIIIR